MKTGMIFSWLLQAKYLMVEFGIAVSKCRKWRYKLRSRSDLSQNGAFPYIFFV
jgi:hypothetical protein